MACKKKAEVYSSKTDDKLQLLFESSLDFKSKCEFQGESWESKIYIYIYIYTYIHIYIYIYIYIYIHVYIWKDFGYYVKTIPRRSTKTSKQRVTYLEDLVAAELKTIRTNGLQKSCDNRKNSRGGRIVFTFYGLCENLLGGYPAVTSLPNAIDSPLQD